MITHSDLGRPSDNESVERRGNTVYFPRAKRPAKSKTPRQQSDTDALQATEDAFKMVYEAKCRDLGMSKTSSVQVRGKPTLAFPLPRPALTLINRIPPSVRPLHRSGQAAVRSSKDGAAKPGSRD